MKKFIPILLGIWGMVFPLEVQAGQTVFQGRIVSNSVWDAAQGPYVIQGKVVIEKGASLTILPGTKVCFDSIPKDGVAGSGFIIQGGLEARGTEAQPVYFIPLAKDGSWGQIYFQHSDPGHSILKHCLVTGGRVVCNASSPTIEQCTLSGSRNALVVGPGSTPRIVGNLIAGNRVGMTFLGEVGESLVSGNFLFDNDYGVCAENFGKTRLTTNQFFGNRISDCLDPLAQALALLRLPVGPSLLKVASAAK